MADELLVTMHLIGLVKTVWPDFIFPKKHLEIMKILYALLIFLPLTSFSQEVSTFTTVTANGGVSVDEAGNIFVAHFGPLPPNPNIGKSIYKITSDGTVSIFVDGQLKVGSGNGFDSQGFLYQSNFADNVIYKISPDGQVLDNEFANVFGPVGITAGREDTLYICSCSTNSIKKISPDGTLINFATSSHFNCPNGITIDDDYNLYTTNFNNGKIIKITPAGESQLLGSTPVGNGHLTYRSKDQMLYIASYTGQQIFKMDLLGAVELLAGTGTLGNKDAIHPLEASFNKPNGIEVSPDECSLYISQDGDVMRRIQFTDSECLSRIENLGGHSTLKLHPNPSSGQVFLKNPDQIKIASVLIFDVLGKQVKPILGGTLPEYDLSSLPTGIYTFIVIEETGARHYKKIVIE